MEFDDIQAILPHRFPITLVDRVLTLIPGQRVVAVKAISGNELWYRGFRSNESADYRYPPVLLLESWAQAAVALDMHDSPGPDVLRGRVIMLGALSRVEFHHSVYPGDVVEHEARIVRVIDDALVAEGESRVGTKVVMTVGSAIGAKRPAELLLPTTAQMTGEAS